MVKSEECVRTLFSYAYFLLAVCIFLHMYKWGWSKNEECVIEPDLDHAVPKPLPPDFLVISNIMCIFPAVVNSSVAQHQDLFVVLV